MLAAFRRYANTWPVRILFVVLVVAFGSWGVADVLRGIGASSGSVASVGGEDITPQQFMAEFQAALRRDAAKLPDPSQMPPDMRMQVAQQTLQRLVTQAALRTQIGRLGLEVPDGQVRQYVADMPDYQGADGKFNRGLLLQALAANNMTENHFIELMRQDIAQHQLLDSVIAGASPSNLLTGMLYRYLNERRRADLLTLPFAGQPLPPAPAESVLRRYYDNNPARYSSPEYRHAKIVVLSPETIGRGLPVSDADLRAYFDQHKAEYIAPEKRSIQVITAASAKVADTLAAQWKTGASWDSMQTAAKAAGASAVPLDDTSKADMPSPELANAAFSAPQGTVVGPVTEPLGVFVLRVSAVTPAKNPSFESLRDTLRPKVAAEHATDLVDERGQKLQDIFAGGAKIDEVPADLGAAGAEGTLDAEGRTPGGQPAPIPASPELRQAIIDTVLKTAPGDAIQPQEGPGHSWFAVAVDSITRPARKPFDEVRAQVLADWQRDQIHHRQEAEAAHLLSLVKSGQTLANAAWGSGLTVSRSEPLSRGRPAPGVPAELSQTLFHLAPGEATMVETNAGFVVAQVAEIIPPDPKGDAQGMDHAREGLTQSLKDDVLQTYAYAVRVQAKPVAHPAVLSSLIQQPGE